MTENVQVNEIPEYIYHYTSQAVLLKILENWTCERPKRYLYATNILCLNDGAEFFYATSVVLEVLKSWQEDWVDPDSKLKNLDIDLLIKHIETLFKTSLMSAQSVLASTRKLTDIFLCCFSAKDDDLSMWRNYCMFGNGISLGFKTKELIEQGEKQGFQFQKCIYQKEEQQRVIKDALIKVINNYRIRTKGDYFYNTEPLNDMILTCTKDFIDEFILLAPQLKHPSFQAEEEYRLILFRYDDIKHPRQYREGAQGLVPFCTLELPQREGYPRIPKIRIGPTSHRELSVSVIKALLMDNLVSCESVEPTDTTYRGELI